MVGRYEQVKANPLPVPERQSESAGSDIEVKSGSLGAEELAANVGDGRC